MSSPPEGVGLWECSYGGLVRRFGRGVQCGSFGLHEEAQAIQYLLTVPYLSVTVADFAAGVRRLE